MYSKEIISEAAAFIFVPFSHNTHGSWKATITSWLWWKSDQNLVNPPHRSIFARQRTSLQMKSSCLALSILQ